MEPNFRDSRRQITAALVRKFGSVYLESILDATQEAFATAIVSWPHHGKPEDQTGWLIRTAERRLIDQLRRSKRETPVWPDLPTSAIEHDELSVFFMACSPKLSHREQVCLMLRALGGLTSAEIGRLLHETEEAVQRRISRAKDKLTVEDLCPQGRNDKQAAVLLTLYLIFTEGYEAARGEEYLRPDLALQALRLTEELAELSDLDDGQLEALLA